MQPLSCLWNFAKKFPISKEDQPSSNYPNNKDNKESYFRIVTNRRKNQQHKGFAKVTPVENPHSSKNKFKVLEVLEDSEKENQGSS